MRLIPRASQSMLPVIVGIAGFCILHSGDAATTPKSKGSKSVPEADPIARIREEAMERSQVMNTLRHLSDLNGPRLTGSPGLRQASEWSRDRLAKWGLANSRLAPWGEFGRGWSLQRFSAQITSPYALPLIAFPKAWSPSLGQLPLETEVVHVDIEKPEDFAKYKGKLRGKVVLDGALQELKLGFDPLATRRTDTNLLALANASDGGSTSSRPATASSLATPEGRAAAALLPSKFQFYAEEGVAVLLQPSRQGEAGTLFTAAATVYPPRPATTTSATKKSSGTKKKKGSAEKTSPAPTTHSPWKMDSPPIIPQITVATEHYNRLVRLAQAGEKLRIEVQLQAEYHTADLKASNVIAEIPGSDLAHEVVMLGAHLDSWHSATGATDNAAGCAVVMEAVRILNTLELKPRRTVRIALWTGEEQGLQGSKAYVAEHFGMAKGSQAPGTSTKSSSASSRTPTGPIEKKPAHDHLSAYFNLDNGAGKIRGIYLQNNEAVRPIFRQWLRPFRDLGAETLSYATTGGTDHLSFDNVGLPGFQFIQDGIEYWTRTHHGNMDVYDRVVADDLKQASAIMAAFVYRTAMRDEKLPRKPEPGTTPVPGVKSSASTSQ